VLDSSESIRYTAYFLDNNLAASTEIADLPEPPFPQIIIFNQTSPLSKEKNGV